MSNKQFLLVIAVTFVVVIIWIIADIVHAKPSVEVNPNLQELLSPINPNFDQKVLSQIQEITPLTSVAPRASIQPVVASSSGQTSPQTLTLPNQFITIPPSPIATSSGIEAVP